MTSHGGVWERIVAEDNFREAWRSFRRHHPLTGETAAFAASLDANLARLRAAVADGSWRPSPYRQFGITDPKPRTISCAALPDRIVHHAICAVIGPLIERRMVDGSFACREGMGTNAACVRARELMRGEDAAYFLKLDIRHYFDTVEHARLKTLVGRFFREREVRELLTRIIDAPLPNTARGRGLPIGNLTSQFFANLYLDALDHLIVEGERVGKRYVRYMDDLLLFVPTKARAWELEGKIRLWLAAERGPEVKDEATLVAPVGEGVPFLGLRIWPGHWRLKASRLRRTRRKLVGRYLEHQRGELSEERLAGLVKSVEGSLAWYGFKGILRPVERIASERIRKAGEEEVGNNANNRPLRGGSFNDNVFNCDRNNRNNATYDNDNDDNGFRLSSIRSENCETKRANPIPRCLRSATDAETKMRGRGGRVGGAIRLKSAGRLKTI